MRDKMLLTSERIQSCCCQKSRKQVLLRAAAAVAAAAAALEVNLQPGERTGGRAESA